jgi:hypothetical protein
VDAEQVAASVAIIDDGVHWRLSYCKVMIQIGVVVPWKRDGRALKEGSVCTGYSKYEQLVELRTTAPKDA